MISSSLKAITVIDDLITSDECKDLINFFITKQTEWKFWPSTNTKYFPIIDWRTGEPHDEYTKMFSSRLVNIVSNVRPDRSHLELRETGTYMGMHYDTGTMYNTFTSVTYLNDDFDGGETVIRPHGEETDKYDTIIVPKTGRTVFYDGAYFKHGVIEVENGNRFTMPMWYVPHPLDYPEKLKWWK